MFLSLPCVLALGSLACTTTAMRVPAHVTSGLDPRADTFAYANQLRWQYDIGERKETPRPASSGVTGGQDTDFAHRCAVMVRVVRQFHYAARFDPTLPRVTDAKHKQLLSRVIATDRRRESPVDERVVIPGFANLRELSLAYGPELQEISGGGWRTWLQRGNWRMIFPFTPDHQRRSAESLIASLARGHPPIVHVMNFPQVDLNHTMLIYRGESDAEEIRLYAYDPNDPETETILRYDRRHATFRMPQKPYFAGGTVKAYEVYDGLLY
jgi:hypothetical protein